VPGAGSRQESIDAAAGAGTPHPATTDFEEGQAMGGWGSDHAGRRMLLLAAVVGVTLPVGGAADAQIDSAAFITPLYCADESAFADGGTTYVSGSCYDWGVTPSYTDTVYADNAAAEAAEPPPPAPVTPSLPTWRNLYDWPNGHGYVGWYAGSSSQAGAYRAQSALGGQYGLWLWPAGGSSYSYSNGNYAEWTYTAPGTTRIADAQVLFAYRNKLLAHHCIDVGFRTGTTIVYENEHCKPAAPPDSQREVTVSLVDPSTNPTTKTLYFRIRVDCGGAATCSKNIPALDPLWTGGFARLLKVDMTLVDDDNPWVTPSGPFYDLNTQYTNGASSYPLTLTSTDPGSGVTHTTLEWIGRGDLAGSPAACDSTHHTPSLDARICPETMVFNTDVDTRALPEGRQVFVGRTSDVAGNAGTSGSWWVAVDRTPPPPVEGFELLSFNATTGQASIGFAGSDDPPLADGWPGSGIDRFEYRYTISGGGWSGWLTSDDSGFDLDSVPAGATIAVEAKVVDNVGNASSLSFGTVVANPLDGAGDDTTPEGYAPATDPDYDLENSDYLETAGASLSAATATPEDVHYLCRLFVGDPFASGAGGGTDINLRTSLHCPARGIFGHGKSCIELKVRVKYLIFFHRTSWKRLKCVNLTVGPLFDRDQKLFFTSCRPGKHTYRGHADVLLTDTVRGREVRGQVESLNRLTITCP
jgi:hypothetical protein